jgi:hypothetical protein
MNRKIVLSAAIIFILLIGLVAFISYTSLGENGKVQKPFYVGVTFGGNNTQDAKTLIDKVKDHTNLFVLQSGQLMADENAVKEIGDYAIANGLRFAAYFDTMNPTKQASWVGIAGQRWGDKFAGVYYGDEAGGKMLDANIDLSQAPATGAVVKTNNGGGIRIGNTNYFANGTIRVPKSNGSTPDTSFWNTTDNTNPEPFVSNNTDTTITYYPNRSIIIEEIFSLTTYYPNGTTEWEETGRNFFTSENGTDRIAQEETYEQILSKNPISNFDKAAETFTSRTQERIENLSNQWHLSNRSFPIFTADYGLYWWDYQSGYDLVLAELGWNNTVAQEIGLVRGAANLQGKSWGTIITWKYMQAPYLTSGEEMFEQMRTSYECGAEYVVVFNYAEDMVGPYGTLQEEHFQALERFWNEVVQNPNIIQGGVKAEAALVLPKNYGWGMRNPNDIIWGLWSTNSTSEQIWTQLQNKIAQYGTRLDIVYEDPAYPVAGRYSNIYYWNQTA